MVREKHLTSSVRDDEALTRRRTHRLLSRAWVAEEAPLEVPGPTTERNRLAGAAREWGPGRATRREALWASRRSPRRSYGLLIGTLTVAVAVAVFPHSSVAPYVTV